MDKDGAVLQGAFLLSDKLCLPSSLSSLQKSDWCKVANPIPDALREICGKEDKEDSWRKKIICVAWLKLLSRENGEDVEEAWTESAFFPLQNALPEINHVVLMELVKSLSAADVFVDFLLRLPQQQICSELERLTEHVRSSPMSEDDVHFLLDVWWELWKGRDKQLRDSQDSIEVAFANQVAHLTCQPASLDHQAAKRLKLDPATLSPNTDVLDIFLHTLKDMKDLISQPELCFRALSSCLDALYTSFFIEHSVLLPTKDKMMYLSKAMTVRENSDKLSSELIREAQQELRASHTPSPFHPSRMSLHEALKNVTELAQFWQDHGLLKVCSSSPPTYTEFKLQQSVVRILAALEKAHMSDATAEQVDEKNKLTALLESLSFPVIEGTSEMSMRVAVAIINHRLEDYQNVALLFASEKSWAACDEQWLDCLVKNQEAFQQRDAVIQLSSMLRSQLHTANVSHCRRLLKVVTAVFTTLSLEDKNEALAAILRLSPLGLFGCPGSSALTASFEQELNMAFNCIIQGGAGAPTEGNLGTAVSLVARVAFQNPEATLRSCCHSAIFNKGAFCLMNKILQQLPALGGVTESKATDEQSEGKRNPTKGSSLLCRCLQETTISRSLADNEKEQFLKFVILLMRPTVTGGGERESLLSPQELVNTFVLPNLSFTSGSLIDLELSLQLLHAALCVDDQEGDSSSACFVLDCSPFPLLFTLAQLHDQALRCWEHPPESAVHRWSMDTKELLTSVLVRLAQVVGVEVAAAPGRWSRALFWLHDKMKELDWTVYFHLKPVWGDHFKNEVPSSLLTVCDLPEQEWSGLDLPQYGYGTGLLPWVECCTLSDSLQSTMLSCLSLDRRRPNHVGMFSKGLLVALTQTFPWCSIPQWSRLLRAIKELMTSGYLHVPFSLEYVDFLPLLDLRRFSYELCLSVLLLRVLQLLCGSSCSHWLTGDGWAHVTRLYAHAVREMMNSLRAKVPLPPSRPQKAPGATQDGADLKQDSLKVAQTEETVQVPCQEVLFVLSQLFCHVQHIQVMMPSGQSEPLFLASLEILSHYEAIVRAFPESSSALENDNTKHFFRTITDNLENQEMKCLLQQKIAQLAPSTA
ncbi:gem-associated protein 4 [Dunckerocampus dactyliophorus]|uniref:gem-associated protein 4 n=1 Tax=Dunckerocampus dactyliophorus TaxID=161453 RepID=UPI0024075384|nr:gem-associated protein 4 [Dunckerocampus dactyliophorus]